MTLEKAIEILELNLKEAGDKIPPDCRKALKLGIEAMKRVNNPLLYNLINPRVLLPGETED